LPLLEPLAKKRIEMLRLSENNLDFLPASIRCLSNLQKLYINDNHLSSIPNEIMQLKQLNHIDISRNNMGFTPQNIAHINIVINNRPDRSATELSEHNFQHYMFKEMREQKQ